MSGTTARLRGWGAPGWLCAGLAALLWLAGCAAAVAPSTVPAASRSAVSPYRLVMQVSNPDPRGWHQALSDALALTKNAGRGNVEIEIVALGAGVGMLRYDSPWPKEVAAVLADGVKVVACDETMKSLLLSPEDMLPGIGYVRAGIIEIMERQRQGWHYVKAD